MITVIHKYKKIWANFCILTLIIAMSLIVGAIIFSSKLLAMLMTFLAALAGFYFLFVREVILRKKQIRHIRKVGISDQRAPAQGAEEWLYGVGYAGKLSQSFAVSFDQTGVCLFFMVDRKNGSTLLRWNKIISATLGHDGIDYIVLEVEGLEFDIVLPFDNAKIDVIPRSLALKRLLQ